MGFWQGRGGGPVKVSNCVGCNEGGVELGQRPTDGFGERSDILPRPLTIYDSPTISSALWIIWVSEGGSLFASHHMLRKRAVIDFYLVEPPQDISAPYHY